MAADDLLNPTRSRAAINGHPLHPMIVPFPIAFFAGALVSDLIYLSSLDPFWARASLCLIGAALAMGALAAILGLIDFAAIKRARIRTGWIHVIGNSTAVTLGLVNFLIRLLGNPADAIDGGGIILSAFVVAILVVSGWMGGELVFRHKIGAIEHVAPLRKEAPRAYDRAAE